MANFDRTSSPPFLRRLLIEPEYRMARHLILILILVVTALNQAFMTMRVGLDVMGHTIFIQVLFLFITYLITCYFNLWVLLPRHLLKKRYIQYMVYLVITIFLLVTFQTAEERMVLSYFNILDDFYTLPRIVVNILSSTALVLLCVSGNDSAIKALDNRQPESKPTGKAAYTVRGRTTERASKPTPVIQHSQPYRNSGKTSAGRSLRYAYQVEPTT